MSCVGLFWRFRVFLFYERSDFGGEVGFVFFNVAFWDVDVGCFLDCVGEMLNR